ncbi:MAG: PHP domain-containing protein [Chloroflexi bacterium]|uniref:PHP domain-containing protein n=1 Tax=Candidatus Chlorohelix allophototropha TaxID=3003348 RepID=A0A8T7MAI1_9CHLR|nr:PHP domain-containing protein [Chloroflexota bacterium]WJW68979.1 PHP domain-containing protein [Chloroflexota bacterium L227-S17]
MEDKTNFAYLQIYTRHSSFGSLLEISELASHLLETTVGTNIAIAVTDTFSVAALPELQRLLAGSNITLLAGMEVGFSFEGNRALPYSLLLLAENTAGYSNLCHLASLALQRAGDSPLTACLSLSELETHHNGLIAISPYFGGAVMSALRLGKTGEAKSRAQALRNLFGIENFYFGFSPISPEHNSQSDNPEIKLNAALSKLARELKVGLVGTGETRYLTTQAGNAYAALRSRMTRTITTQFPASLLQRAQGDWLFAPTPLRPNAPLYLRNSAELQLAYSKADALGNNQNIAARCSSWDKGLEFDSVSKIKLLCEDILPKIVEEAALELAHTRIQLELAELAQTDMAGTLLAMFKAIEAYGDSGILIPRGLDDSFIAWILGLNRHKPAYELVSPVFEGRAARLLAGLNAEMRVMAKLGSSAPLAKLPSEIGAIPLAHPRFSVVSLHQLPLSALTPLQPAETKSGDIVESMLAGGVLPETIGLLEIEESKTVAWVEHTLAIINKGRETEPRLSLVNLPVQAPSESDDRDYLRVVLEYLMSKHPAACYGAALGLAEFHQRAAIAEMIRRSGVKLLSPDLQKQNVECTLEGENSLRAGLCLAVNRLEAAKLSENANLTLEELAQKFTFDPEAWERLCWSGALDGFAQRETLANNIATLHNYSRAYADWKSQQQKSEKKLAIPERQGQLSLFDLPETENEMIEPATLPPVLSLAETSEKLPKLQLLRHQFEALGFYTAEHPLWDWCVTGAADANRSDPVELVQALKADTIVPLTVGGFVTGLRRIPLAAEQSGGQEFAVALLEDWSGRAELVIPHLLLNGGTNIAEGEIVFALVRRVIPNNQNSRPALVAEAISLTPFAENAAGDFEESANYDTTPESAAPVPSDEWATSLFSQYEAQENKTATTSPEAKASKPKASAKKVVETPQTRRVHIYLPRTDDPDEDTGLMVALKKVLEQFPGQDDLYIYLPKEGSGFKRFRPATLSVAYSSDLLQAVQALLGPDSIKVDE